MSFDVDGEVTISDYSNDQELVETYIEYQKGRYGEVNGQ